MVVKDDGEAERIFTAEKVAPVKKNGLDRSCSCWGEIGRASCRERV